MLCVGSADDAYGGWTSTSPPPPRTVVECSLQLSNLWAVVMSNATAFEHQSAVAKLGLSDDVGTSIGQLGNVESC